MESFLTVLLIVGGIVYKIYSEYQKEQEKARQRRPHIPVPSVEATKPVPLRREVPQPTKSVTPHPPVTPKLHTAPKKVKEVVYATSDPVFDLRQAVIQSAILNRPY